MFACAVQYFVIEKQRLTKKYRIEQNDHPIQNGQHLSSKIWQFLNKVLTEPQNGMALYSLNKYYDRGK